MSECKLKTEKTEKKVMEIYKKIEDTVVGGYQKIEDTAIGGYKNVEQKFVDKFLENTDTKDKEEK